MKQLLPLCFLMMSGINVWGQQLSTYSIQGSITEQETKEPVEFVNVSLFNAGDSSLSTGVVTDKNGEFSFTSIKEGNYYLQISCIGFESFKTREIK